MPEPLKALFIDAADISGGAQRSLLTLLNELPSHGIEPRLLAADQHPDGLLERAAAADITASYIELQHWSKSLSGAFAAARQCAGGRKMLRMVLEDFAPDIVIANGIHAGLFCTINLPSGTPFILHHRDVRAPLRALQGVSERAAAVVTVSEYAAERTREQLTDTLHHKITAVHNGVSVTLPPPAEVAPFRDQFGFKDDTIVVSIVADFVEWKNQRAFIAAVLEVSKTLPQAVGLVVGGSRDEAGRHLEAELKRRCVNRPIVFTGSLPTADLAYAVSDIVVSAAEDEPFGRTMIEALAHGCKVVAVGGSGPEEILGGCKNTVIISAPAEIAAGIRRAVEMPESADSATARAARFSPGAQADKMAEIIRKVANG
jgi:glycosyltransferase involved in cell wall biosynthesis